MIPYPFTYKRAASLTETVALLRQNPEAKLLAGGQTLVAVMRARLAAPSLLIDISNLAELRFIRREGDALIVGAGMSHADIAQSADVIRVLPALGKLAESIGDPAVRHKGTLGGSIANNDPAADYPAALVALDAKITTTKRVIAAEAFFTGMFATMLEDDEIVTTVTFPRPERAAYAKFRNPASHYAMAGVFVARFKETVRLAVIGAGPCVFRLPNMEAALSKEFSAKAIDKIYVDAGTLLSDLHGSAEYRANLVQVMAGRAVADAMQ